VLGNQHTHGQERRKIIDIQHFVQRRHSLTNGKPGRGYREADSGRFVMIAHGIDGSFTQNAMSITPPMKYILTRGVMETPEGQQLYRERVGTLFTNVFKLDVMTNRIHSAAARLEKGALTEQERTNITARTASFVRRVIERHGNVSKQFGSPVSVVR